MRLLLLTLALVLMGQNCEPPPPPGPNEPSGGTDYCYGLDYTVYDSVVQGVKRQYNTIIDGEISVNRRATVKVSFGQAYCTGVVLTPHTVLTAAHCGYGETTLHQIRLDDDPEVYLSSDHTFHPAYQDWIDAAGGTAADVFDVHGELFDAATGQKHEGVAIAAGAEGYSAGSREGRKSDIMVLYTDQVIPGPYIDVELYTYRPELYADRCYGVIIQGYGQNEAGRGGTLREAKYKVTSQTEKSLQSVLTDVGKICYGDSGGPAYADVGPGGLYLAGITSTTMSADCLRGGTHVKIAAPTHITWLLEEIRP